MSFTVIYLTSMKYPLNYMDCFSRFQFCDSQFCVRLVWLDAERRCQRPQIGNDGRTTGGRERNMGGAVAKKKKNLKTFSRRAEQRFKQHEIHFWRYRVCAMHIESDKNGSRVLKSIWMIYKYSLTVFEERPAVFNLFTQLSARKSTAILTELSKSGWYRSDTVSLIGCNSTLDHR